MLSPDAGVRRGLAFVALAALGVSTSIARAGWLWEPRMQVTDSANPILGATAEDGAPAVSDSLVWHQAMRVWDTHLGVNNALAYYLRVGPQWDVAARWPAAELVTDTASGHRMTDLAIAIGDSDEDVHFVTEVFGAHDTSAAADQESRIAYRHRTSSGWGGLVRISPDWEDQDANTPNIWVQRSPLADTLHVVFNLTGQPGLRHRRKAAALGDSAWEAPTVVTTRIGAGGGVRVDSLGQAHFFGIERRPGSFGGPDTLDLWHFRGIPPGSGSWDLDSTRVATHVVPRFPVDSPDPDQPAEIHAITPDAGPFHWAWAADSVHVGGEEKQIYYSRGTVGGVWNSVVAVTGIDGVSAHDPGIAVAPSGAVHVLYSSPDPFGALNQVPTGHSELFHTISVDGGSTWSRPMSTSPETRTVSGRPRMVAWGDTVGVIFTSHDDDESTPPDDDFEVWSQRGFAIADTLESANVTWSGAVYLDADFEVQTGKTLTIEPGTRVFAAASSGAEKVDLIVSGRLIAVGTADDPVTFASYDGAGVPGDWGGITFPAGTDPTSSRIENAVIRDAVDGVRIGSANAPVIRYNSYLGNADSDVLILRDVWIPEGSEWEFSGAARILAAASPTADDPLGHSGLCDLLVDGTLTTSASGVEHATFGVLGTGQWGGITLVEGAIGATSRLEQAEIRDAADGLRVNTVVAPVLLLPQFANNGTSDILLTRDTWIPEGSEWELGGAVRILATTSTAADDPIGHAGVCDLLVDGTLVIGASGVDYPTLGVLGTGQWGGITLVEGSIGAANRLEQAEIRDAVDGLRINTAVPPLLRHVRFANNGTSDILLTRDTRIPVGLEWLLDGPTRVVAVETPATEDTLGTTGYTDLIVLGTLVTQAATPDSVWFESVAKDGANGDDWAGITVGAGGRGLLRNCDIGYALRGVYFADADSAVLVDSRVHHYSQEGVFDYASDALVQACNVTRGSLDPQIPTTAIHAKASAGEVRDNTITWQTDFGIWIQFGKLTCKELPWGPTDTLRVIGNTITGASGATDPGKSAGIRGEYLCLNNATVIDGNEVTDWSGRGIELYQTADVQVSCNRFDGNYAGAEYFRNESWLDPGEEDVWWKGNSLRQNTSDNLKILYETGLQLYDAAGGGAAAEKNTLQRYYDDLDSKNIRIAGGSFDPVVDARHQAWLDASDAAIADSATIQATNVVGPAEVKVGSALSGDESCTGGEAAAPQGGRASLVDSAHGPAGSPSLTADAPVQWSLTAIGPNPTSGAVSWILAAPVPSTVRLAVYDVRGRLVRRIGEAPVAVGYHEWQWDRSSEDGGKVVAGVYFLRVESSDFRHTRKVVLLPGGR